MYEHKATLVVIEFGASWPGWLDPGSAGNTAVVAQHYEGEPVSLVTQVESRLERLAAMRWRIDAVVLVSNGRGDLPALSARSLLARSLIQRLRRDRGKTLHLTLSSEVGLRAAHALSALSSTLRGAALAADITIEARVDEREPSSVRAEFGPAAQAS